jgi:hypothetical protein
MTTKDITQADARQQLSEAVARANATRNDTERPQANSGRDTTTGERHDGVPTTDRAALSSTHTSLHSTTRHGTRQVHVESNIRSVQLQTSMCTYRTPMARRGISHRPAYMNTYIWGHNQTKTVHTINTDNSRYHGSACRSFELHRHW